MADGGKIICTTTPSPELPDEAIRPLPSLVLDWRTVNDNRLCSVDDLPVMNSEDVFGIEFSYIESTLQRYLHDDNIVLHTFKLDVGMETFDFSDINQSITIATRKGLRNLVLSSKGKFIEIPATVPEAKSLVELSLTKCRLKFHQRLMWPHLKSLRLYDVELDQLMLDNIFRSCPLIEALEISLCQILHQVRIPNGSHGMGTTPNPEHLPGFGSWFNLPASQFQYLRSLSISGMPTDDKIFIDLSPIFPHLEDLAIVWCSCLKEIKILSVSLKKLELAQNQNLKEAQFDVPSLVLFEYKGILDPRFLFTRASATWTSNLNIISFYANVHTAWFFKLKEFLTKLNGSGIHVVAAFDNEWGYFKAPGKDATCFQVEEIEEFGVMRSSSARTLPADDYKELALAIIGGIFWTCRPRVIRTKWYSRRHGYTESLYKILVLGDKAYYSRSPEGTLWQCSMKGIDIFHSKLAWRTRMDQMQSWNEFLRVLEAQNQSEITVFFNLEWETSALPDMSQKAF